MKPTKFITTKIHREPKEFGKTIEEQIRQAIATNQPLDGKAEEIFTPAADGVLPQYDIRADKQDLALAANDKYQASDAMKGFINQVEIDKDGNDGKEIIKPTTAVTQEQQQTEE